LIIKTRNQVQNLFARTITGIVFISCIIGSLVWHPVAFAVVIFILMIIGLKEFYQLSHLHNIHPDRYSGYAVASAMYILLVLYALGIISHLGLTGLVPLVFIFFVGEMFRSRENSIVNLAFSIFPVAYITIPLAMLVFLAGPTITGENPYWQYPLAFFIILWSHDTFAYLTGIILGKHKLMEKISPKKTWEGSVGGTIFGLLAGYILSLFFPQLNMWQWLGAAMIIVVTGTLGDLSESLLKRSFHVKDSGTTFPGHGGVLDRFDAVLFSAPSFLCYLLLIRI
jgi:phosphatidate cytidylyltransferase